MKMQYSKFSIVPVLVLTVLLSACFNSLAEQEGKLSIVWGKTGNSRAFLQEGDLPGLRYFVTLTGPGKTQEHSFFRVPSATFTVIPGTWTVTIKGYESSFYGDFLKVLGIEQVHVTAGRNGVKTASMYTASEAGSWAELNGIVSGENNSSFTDTSFPGGVREEIIIIKNSFDFNPQNGDGTINIIRPIILISETDEIIGRDGTWPSPFASFFSVSSGGILTLGKSGMAGALTFDNEEEDSESLLTVKGVTGGSLIMNSGVTITGGNTVNGGAVYVEQDSVFTMNGGTISGNKSAGSGGGVFVKSGGTFVHNGGTIRGNEPDNVYHEVILPEIFTVKLDAAGMANGDSVSFSSGAAVLQKSAGAGDVITIYYTLANTGSSTNQLILSFNNPANNAAFTVPGASTFSYTTDAADAVAGEIIITATFQHSNLLLLNSSNFSVTNNTYPYNGSVRSATVGYSGGLTEALAGTITVGYLLNGSTASPVNAGTYTITVTTPGTAAYAAITAPLSVGSLTISPAAGATLNAPTVSGTPTQNRIIVNTIPASTGQSVQYAITTSTSTSLPGGLTWQSGTTFNGLLAGTTYYVWAQAMANTNYNAGTAVRSAAIPTAAGPAIAITSTGLDALKVGDRVGMSITYTLTNGTYAASINPANFAVSNLPPGLTAETAIQRDDTTVIVNIIGAPTTYNASTRSITLPASVPAANVTGASAAITPTGTVTASAVARGDGAPVSGAPERIGNATYSSIGVFVVTNAGSTGQDVEYAISKVSNATPSDGDGWQPGTTFSELDPSTTYYVYARTAANSNYNAGTAQQSEGIQTAAAPAIVVTFDELRQASVNQPVDANITYTLTNSIYASTITASDFAVSGLPNGLNAATAVRTSNTVVTVNINGVLTTANTSPVNVTLPANIPAANVSRATGPIPVSGAATFPAVNKAPGAYLAGPPAITVNNVTSNSITVNPVTVDSVNPGNQPPEYAIGTVQYSMPGDGEWQSGTTFNGLASNTTYYVWARTAETANYSAGMGYDLLVSTLP